MCKYEEREKKARVMREWWLRKVIVSGIVIRREERKYEGAMRLIKIRKRW